MFSEQEIPSQQLAFRKIALIVGYMAAIMQEEKPLGGLSRVV